MYGFILRNHKKGLVYDGSPKLLEHCLNMKEAIDRWNRKPGNVGLIEYKVKIFGRNQKLMIPGILDEAQSAKSNSNNSNNSKTSIEESDDVTSEFLGYIIQKGKEKLISDISLGRWLEVLKNHNVLRDKHSGFIYFAHITADQQLTYQHNPQTAQEKSRYVLMKEFMDGYSYFDQYEFIQHGGTNSKGSDKHLIDISYTYELANANEPDNPTIIPYNYTLALRKAMFGANQEQDIGPNKLLMDWQYDVIQRQARKTIIYGSRRSGKCIWEFGKVRLANGTFVYARDVKVGDKLLASKPSDHKEGNHKNYVTVKDVDKFQKECVEVVLDNGMSFVVSSDHRIPTQSTFSKEGRDMDIDNYTLAKDLKPGEDFVPTNNRIYFSHNNNKYKSEGLLVGIFLGDGVNGTGKISCHQQEIADYLLEKLPGSTYNNSFVHINQNTIKAITTRKNDNYTIEEWKNFYGLNNLSYNKFIVNQIFGYGNSFKRGVVEGLILSDGYIQIKNNISGRKDNIEIIYTTTSKQLAKDIQIILGDLGVFSYIREKKITTQFKSNTDNLAYDVHISDKDSLKKIFRYTNISTKKNFTEALDIINTRDGYTNNTLNLIPLQAVAESDTKKFEINGKWFDNTREKEYNLCRRKAEALGLSHWKQYFRSKVVEVKPIGIQNVIHIEVDGDRTYRYEGCLTHNTFLLAFLARREIMAQRLNFQNTYRPTSVLYLGLSDNKNLKVVSYLQGMDKQFNKNAAGMFTWNQQQKMYSFKSGKETLGTITFLSAEAKDPGVGDYADLIIIDEAIKMPNSIWEGLEPIVANEGAKLLTASTLYYDAPRGWNYDLMLEAEKHSLEHQASIYNFIDREWKQLFEPLTKKSQPWTIEDRQQYQKAVNEWMDKNERAGLRYTIDDIEYIPEKRREAEKARMWENNPQRYYAELYSRFSDEGKVFNYNGCLTDVESQRKANPNKTYQYVTVSHDSAGTFDVSAAIVGGRDPELKKVVLFGEREINQTGYYEDQAKEIKSLLMESYRYCGVDPSSLQLTADGRIDTTKFIDPKKRVYFVCDGNQKATAELFQMAGVDIDYRLCYSAKGQVESQSKYIYNEINIPKHILIDIATKMLDNGFVLLSTELRKLIQEFDTYTRITNPQTGTVKYVKGKTDDFIHAYMMICYFFYEKLNLKIELVEGKKELNEGLARMQGLSKDEILEIKTKELLKKKLEEQKAKQREQEQMYYYNHVY